MPSWAPPLTHISNWRKEESKTPAKLTPYTCTQKMGQPPAPSTLQPSTAAAVAKMKPQGLRGEKMLNECWVQT